MTLLEFYRAHWLTMLKLEPKLLERMLTAAQHGMSWEDFVFVATGRRTDEPRLTVRKEKRCKRITKMEVQDC